MQREDLAKELIYDALAQLLPTMGRDFVVSIQLKPHDKDKVGTNITFTPLTPLGRAILPHIRDNLTPMMQKLAQERGMAENDQPSEPGTQAGRSGANTEAAGEAPPQPVPGDG